MRKSITRGLLVGVAATVVVLLYVLLRYGYKSGTAFATQVSTDLFQIGLILLIFGVIISLRLFRFRREMGLPNYLALLRIRTKAEYDEHKKVEEDLREKEEEEDQIAKEESRSNRDYTVLVASIFTILISIILTANQVK